MTQMVEKRVVMKDICPYWSRMMDEPIGQAHRHVL